MEHSVTAYLKRLSTETLESLLQKYINDNQEEHFVYVIDEVVKELTRREKGKTGKYPL